MKILVVSQFYYPEQFRINDICGHLAADGHDVTVLTGLPNYPGGKVLKEYRWPHKRKEEVDGVKIVRCFEIGRGKGKLGLSLNYLSFMLAGSLKALLMREDFDVVLANQSSPVTMAVPALIYSKMHRKKTFLYCLDVWPDCLAAAGISQDSIVYKILHPISRQIYKSADRIGVTSEPFIDYFQQVLKLDTDNIEYIPQYAEELFSGVNEQQRPHQGTNLVFAGNIGAMQGIETILKAAQRLKRRSDICFHLVGGGSALDASQKQAEAMKLQNVRFYGQRPLIDMPEFYARADAMLVTLNKNDNVSNTLPGKVQSYMAAGKPVLGSIDGEANRVIKASRCGLCCPAEDHRAFAKIIETFADNPAKHRIYAGNSLKYYQHNFDETAFFTSLYKNLEMLCDKPEPVTAREQTKIREIRTKTINADAPAYQTETHVG